jgi:two-component system, cell cycle sensor histidine kinase and response regulator CckA
MLIAVMGTHMNLHRRYNSQRAANLGQLLQVLIAPAGAIRDIALRRSARLLAIFLVIMSAVFVLLDLTRSLTTSGYRVPWYGYLFLGTAYALSRTRYYTLAASLTVAMFPIVVFSSVLQRTAPHPIATLNYLVVGLLFGSIFLSVRGLAVLAIVDVAGILLLPVLAPTTFPTFDIVITLLATDTIAAILALVFIQHRNQIERDRQAELRASQERLKLALDAARMGTWNWDAQTNTITWSEQFEQVFGLQPGTFGGTYEAYLALLHPEDRAYVDRVVTDVLAGRNTNYALEHRIIVPDGDTRWLEGRGQVYWDASGAPLRMTGTITDITDRKRADAALRASEERYRAISEVASDYAFAYWVGADGSAVLEWVTDAFTRLTGYAVENMRTLAQWSATVYPDDRELLSQQHQRMLAGQPDSTEYRIVASDGRLLWLRISVRPVWDAAQGRVVRVYGAAQDITRLKHLEQQLTHAQKMEAIGRLAGGIAHDFNNILTVILGNINMMIEELDPTHPLHRDAEQVQQAAERAARLTRQLLAFSRQQVLQPQVLGPNTLITGIEQMLRRLIGEDIQLVTRLALDLGAVRADPGQLEQVILNLAVNARDVMPDGGTMVIETANVELDAAYPREHVGTVSGPYIMLAISDTGYGMDAATQAHMFEPFFTTKGLGKGTGLGLSTVHGIVTQSGGHIWVYSEPGHGATFKIYLPRIEEIDELPTSAPTAAELPHGTGTILLVEDDAQVRALVGRVLCARGYQVLDTAEGPAALQIAAQHPGAIDLLLTDMIMPGGLSGRQVAEQVLAHCPAARVLYMSGYPDSVLAQHQLIAPNQVVLQKPFTPEVLAQTVWEVLQR